LSVLRTVTKLRKRATTAGSTSSNWFDSSLPPGEVESSDENEPTPRKKGGTISGSLPDEIARLKKGNARLRKSNVELEAKLDLIVSVLSEDQKQRIHSAEGEVEGNDNSFSFFFF